MHSNNSQCSLTVSPTQEKMSPVEGLVAVNVGSVMVQQQSCDCKGRISISSPLSDILQH